MIKNLKKKLMLTAIFLVIVLITPIFSAKAVDLRVMAASSMRDVMQELKFNFEEKHPNYNLELNFAGSQVLFRQIQIGGGADIFISANYNYIKKLQEIDLLAGEYIFAENEIAVVFNEDSRRADSIKELLNGNYRIVIAAEEVPVGNYTRELINKYFNSIKTQKTKDRLKNNYSKAIISKEFDVKSVVNKVELGAADAGFVYLSDYYSSKNLQLLKIDSRFNVKVSYYTALIKDSKNIENAQVFISYLLSETGKEILEKYNFKTGVDING